MQTDFHVTVFVIDEIPHFNVTFGAGFFFFLFAFLKNFCFLFFWGGSAKFDDQGFSFARKEPVSLLHLPFLP